MAIAVIAKRISSDRLLLGIIICMVVIGCSSPDQQNTNSTPTTTVVLPTPVATRASQTQVLIGSPITRSAIEDIRERGALRVGVLFGFRPFGYLAEDGNLHGFEVDLVRKIAESWGVEPVFVQVTRQTRMDFLYRGDIDFIAAAVPHTREQEENFDFTNSTFRSGSVALVANDSTITAPVDLNTQQIAVIGADALKSFQSFQSEHQIAANVIPVETASDAVMQFAAGTVVSIVGRREDIMLASISLQNTRILTDYVRYEPYAFAVRKGDTPLRELLNLTLQNLARSGELGTIFSATLYGYSADVYPTLPGDSTLTFETFPTSIGSAPSRAELSGRVLRVAGLDLSSQPMPFDNRPIVDGFNRAVINEMARRWNTPIQELPESSGAAGVAMLEGGEADIVLGIRPDASLFGRVAFSEPYFNIGLRLARSNTVTIGGIGDLQFKPVAAIAPLDISQDLILKNSEYAKVQTFETPEEAYEALNAATVYAVVGDEFSLFLMGQADQTIEVDSTRYRSASYVILLPFSDFKFKQLVDRTLQDMKVDGTLGRLIQQYLGPYVPAENPLEEPEMEIWP